MKARVNQTQINYTIDGPEGAPWVTLSHSLACDLSMWDEQVSVLKQRYRVLRFDTRGHGQSDAPAGDYTLAQLAQDTNELLAALNIESTHFVGLSMGGMIGQTLALSDARRLRSLVLCDTTSRIPEAAQQLWADRIQIARSQGMQPHVEPTLARWFTESYRRTRADVMQRVANMITATPPAGYAGCCAAIRQLNLTERLGAIALPTLIIVGEQDAGTPVSMSRDIQAALPRAKLTILPNASHLSNIEQPELFNRALMEFLASV